MKNVNYFKGIVYTDHGPAVADRFGDRFEPNSLITYTEANNTLDAVLSSGRDPMIPKINGTNSPSGEDGTLAFPKV